MITQFLSNLENRCYSRNTIILYGRLLRNFAAYAAPLGFTWSSLSGNDIYQYLLLQKSWSGESRRSFLSALSSFYDFIRLKSPVVRWLRPRRQRHPLDVVPASVVSSVFRSSCSRDVKGAVLLAYDCGLRYSEICALSCDCVDFDAQRLHIRSSKGGKSRFVPMTKRVAAYLKSLGRFASAYNHPDFEGRLAIANALSQYGHHYSCHCLRHSFASNRVAEGISIEKVQYLLGHSNILTTSYYVHYFGYQ